MSKSKIIYPVEDELDFLKIYTEDQIKNMWESCKPKIKGIKGRVIILSDNEKENDQNSKDQK